MGETAYTDVWAGSTYIFRLQATDRVGNAVEESASLVYNGEPPQVSVDAQAQVQDDDIVVTWSASAPLTGSGQAGSGLDAYVLQVCATSLYPCR